MALAVADLGLLIGIPGGGYSPAAMAASVCLALASAAGFAAMTLMGVSPVPGLDDQAVTGIGSPLGGPGAAPASRRGRRARVPADGRAIWLLAGLGTGPTALAYTLYYRGLRSASPTTAVLGDRLSAPGIAGAVLLAAAVISAVRLDGRLTGVTATSG